MLVGPILEGGREGGREEGEGGREGGREGGEGRGEGGREGVREGGREGGGRESLYIAGKPIFILNSENPEKAESLNTKDMTRSRLLRVTSR